MTYGKLLIVMACPMLLIACGTTVPTSDNTTTSGSLGDILIQVGGAEATAGNAVATYDIVKKWTGTKPAGAETVNFSNSDFFDMQLRASLLEKRNAVKVDFTETYSANSELPPRLNNWFSKVQSSGGQVMICPVNKSKEIFGTLQILSSIVVRWARKLDQYLTYSPAVNYHAAILVSSEEPNMVKSALFVNRASFGEFKSPCVPLSISSYEDRL